MTKEELYELMEDGNLGYACVFKREDQGTHTDYMFKMTAENIANFIGKNAYTAELPGSEFVPRDYSTLSSNTDGRSRT